MDDTGIDLADAPVVRRGSGLAFAASLAGVLGLALLLRIRLAQADPSYDELWHLALSTGRGTPLGAVEPGRVYVDFPSQIALANPAPWWHVWTHMNFVLHPPLYCLTLRWWRDVLGESMRAAQAYSIAWSVVGIAVTALAARLAMGPVIATLVALALALAPTQIYLAQEIRGYAMLFAIGAVGLRLMTRVEVLGPTRRVALALGLVPLPMLLTHYFGFGAAVAIGLYGTWRLVGHRRAFLTALVAGAAVYAITWLPFASRQLGDLWTGDVFLRVPERDLLKEGVLFATAPFRLIVDRRFAAVPLSSLAIALFVVPWFLTRRLAALRPWALWLACSIGSLVVLDLARSTIHLGYARYLTVATPAVFVIVVGCAYAIRRWAGVVAAILLVVLAGASLRFGIDSDGDIPFDVEPIHRLANRAGPGDGLILCRRPDSPYFADILLLHCSAELGFLPRPMVQLDGPMSSELARLMPRRNWILSISAHGPAERIVPGAKVLSSEPMEGGLVLSCVELTDAPSTLPSPAGVP